MLTLKPHQLFSASGIDKRPVYWATGTIKCPVCSESWSSLSAAMRMDLLLPDCVMIEEDYTNHHTGKVYNFKTVWIVAPDLNLLCSDKCLELYKTFPVLYENP